MAAVVPAAPPSEGKRVVGFTQQGETRFGYDAVETPVTKKRRIRSSIIQSEDGELDDSKRRRLGGTTHDLRRNFSLIGWALRKHLDYVCDHSCQFFTPNDELNKYLEAWVLRRTTASEFDIAGRHDLKAFTRITEASSIVGGDCGWHLVYGGRVQGMEFDRVQGAAPGNLADGQRWVNGVLVNRAGRALGYAVHERTSGGGYKFEKVVEARWMLWHGFFERIDQVRGVAPIASAANTFQDTYEALELAQAKAKVAQIFIAAIYRDADDTGEEVRPTAAEDEVADDGTAKPRYDVSFSKPTLLDLDPGDRAEILANATPSNEFQDYMRLTIAIALLALDIPYSFFDASLATFFGNKTSKDEYVLSAKEKRRYVRESRLYPWLRWRLLVGYLTGELDLARFGVDFSIFDSEPYEWIPAGIPWWDPSKDIRADVMAISAGLRTRGEIRRERYGDDWATAVVPQLKKEQDLLEKNGIWITEAGPEIFAPEAATVETDDRVKAGGRK